MKRSRSTATRSVDLLCSKCQSGEVLSYNCGHLICRKCSKRLKKCYVCKNSKVRKPQLWPQHIHAKQLVDMSKNSFSTAKRRYKKRPRHNSSDDDSDYYARHTKVKINSSDNKCVTVTSENSSIPIIINGHIPVEVRRSSRFSNVNEATYYYPKLKNYAESDSDSDDDSDNDSNSTNDENTDDEITNNSSSISSFLKNILQKTVNCEINQFSHYGKLRNQEPSKTNGPIETIERNIPIVSPPKDCGVQVTPVINSVSIQTDQINLDKTDNSNDKKEDPPVLNLVEKTENVPNEIEKRQEPKTQVYEIPVIVDSVNLDSDSEDETPCNKITNNCLAIESSSEDEENNRQNNTPVTNDTEPSSEEEIDSSEVKPLVPFRFKGRTQNETKLSGDYMRFEVKAGDKKYPITKSDLGNFVVKVIQETQPENETKKLESPSSDNESLSDKQHQDSEVSCETQRDLLDIDENSIWVQNILKSPKENQGEDNDISEMPRWITNSLERNKRLVKRSFTIEVYPDPIDQICRYIPRMLDPERPYKNTYQIKVPRVMNLIDVTLQKLKQLNIDSRPNIVNDSVQSHIRLRLLENEDSIVFADHGLQPEQHLDLMEYIKSHDFEYSETVDENTSYLIVANQFDIQSLNTIKLLMAIAHKKPILTANYFYNSNRYDRLLSISEYVVKLPGPLSCLRLRRAPLFSDYVFHVTDGLKNPSTEEIKELLKACGGTIVERLEDSLSVHFQNYNKMQIINDLNEPEPELETMCRENSITRVDFEWVRESVFYYELVPLEKYFSFRRAV